MLKLDPRRSQTSIDETRLARAAADQNRMTEVNSKTVNETEERLSLSPSPLSPPLLLVLSVDPMIEGPLNTTTLIKLTHEITKIIQGKTVHD